MDETEHQNLQDLTDECITFNFMKKVTQLVLTISVFSFLFSYYPIFLHCFKFYFSTLPFKLLTHTLDKNSTFLICNGILVFLANTSGLLRSRSRFHPNYYEFRLTKNISGDVLLVTKESLLEKQVLVETPPPPSNGLEEEHEEKYDEYLNNEEEEEEVGMLSTEELNKKCEDFIRRVKEEIRIEAQGQLVMVS